MVILILVIIVNKKFIVVLLAFLVIGALAFFIWKYTSNNSDTNYEASKTSVNNTEQNNNTDNKDENSTAENNSTQPQTQNQTQENSGSGTNTPSTNPAPTTQIQEEILSTFSTKIYSTDASRQNNISITCSVLNGTTVKNGETFSFCNTVGPSSTAKGYQKADIFDKNGNKKKGLGGGNCQISTTLYNAVLAVPSLVVTERHQHSNYVPYIQKGKDAAVAYGSYDFKFTNSSGNDIKIMASSDGKNVTVSLIALK